VDERADLFAVGALLRACLAGGSPFGTASIEETLLRSASGERGERGRSYPDGIERVLDRALASSPDDRFGSASELRIALGLAAHRDGIGPIDATALKPSLEGLGIFPPRSGVFAVH
jgi:serine/threonine-protein kinase